MLENDKTGTEEEKFGLHGIQDSQKYERKKPETLHEISVECRMVKKRLEKKSVC